RFHSVASLERCYFQLERMLTRVNVDQTSLQPDSVILAFVPFRHFAHKVWFNHANHSETLEPKAKICEVEMECMFDEAESTITIGEFLNEVKKRELAFHIHLGVVSYYIVTRFTPMTLDGVIPRYTTL
ncbi:unnamed protein product, partial [Sphenostylis stenocarpa]